ncbi:MAG: hypothetical protein KKD64_05355 [Alphaproteobacteria bacterium]|nr:hypothetical protein [Alphaproteobacteria bacterium]MBU0795452.1 hypothetical protein [Alphaproteobacteria bacterium]MBU0875746.1 hypothetical protein [Alphaproteobacteria bacterium]MBU1769063.1 hypothetical protein [Alphaproteobacteria bacterium]
MHLPILVNRRSYDDATALIEAFGEHAGVEAALRADRSRDVGNHVRFCHWRQVERMLFLLQVEHSVGTVH